MTLPRLVTRIGSVVLSSVVARSRNSRTVAVFMWSPPWPHALAPGGARQGSCFRGVSAHRRPRHHCRYRNECRGGCAATGVAAPMKPARPRGFSVSARRQPRYHRRYRNERRSGCARWLRVRPCRCGGQCLLLDTHGAGRRASSPRGPVRCPFDAQRTELEVERDIPRARGVALRRHDGDVGHVSVTKIDPARSRLTPAPSETASSNWSDWSIILSRGGCHG